MNNLKKVFAGAFAMAMVVSGTTSGVFAATQTGTTNVSYDNTNSIPDPGNPDNSDWAVKIPSSIVFSDTVKKVDASVELVAVNGGVLPTTDITITVASTNDYTLDLASKDDAMQYALMYGGTTMSNTTTTVGIVKDTNTKISGEAVLKGSAKKVGAHTDTLTYTVNH